jgi:hypothetical protein
MIAQIGSFTGVPIERLSEGRTFTENGTGRLRALPGYQGGYAPLDRASGRVLVVGLWESPEATAQAEPTRSMNSPVAAAFDAVMNSPSASIAAPRTLPIA